MRVQLRGGTRDGETIEIEALPLPKTLTFESPRPKTYRDDMIIEEYVHAGGTLYLLRVEDGRQN